MHTEATLQELERATTIIGHELRSFRKTTQESFTCMELPSEVTARGRRKLNKQMKQMQASAKGKGTVAAAPGPQLAPKVKILNLFTYKFHSLGDYVRTIRLFGTTDSYSTQIVRIYSCFVILWRSWSVACIGRTSPPPSKKPLSGYQQSQRNSANREA
jgi:hypothetical protein